MKYSWSLGSFCAVFLFATSTWASSPEIVTDRPDVAESSQTVGVAVIQVEAGVDVQRTGDETVWGFPTKLRLGLTANSEFHFESGLIALTSASEQTNATSDDVDFGGKYHFGTYFADRMSLGILGAVTVPMASTHSKAPRQWTFSPTLAADWDLSVVGLGTNIGLDVSLNGPHKDHGIRYAVAVGFDLMDRWSIYAEQFGRIGLSEGGLVELSTDFGTAFLVTPQVQLDLYGRVGLNDAAQGFGGGSGVSLKF